MLLNILLLCVCLSQVTSQSYVSFGLQNLYALGARKFALISIPPVGCMPFELLLAKTWNRNTCVSYINQEVRNFNVELLALTVELQATFRDAHFVYLNAYDVTMDAITHPSKYGIALYTQCFLLIIIQC